MSQGQYNPKLAAGEISTRETKRGLQFYAFNSQHRETRCIGTLSGQVYEKAGVILQQPEASFSLTKTELRAIEEMGGQFIRLVCRGTYSISVSDFRKFAQPYFNSAYGDQLRVTLDHFAFTSRTSRRNKIIDSPVLEQPGPIAPREKSKQLDFSRLLDR